MPLDQKEPVNLIPETPERSLSPTETTGREIAPQPERPRLETGDVLETGRLATGNERLTPPEMSSARPVYSPSTDPAYLKYKEIEKVLEEDLGELYNNLTPKEQKEFKIKGEEAARSIFQLVYHKTKIKVKKIIKLIKNWLKVIPGINKFFLEQEAKIKADKIIALANEDKKVEF